MNQELLNKIKQFMIDRDWKQFHNGKDLAISLSLEASELLEIFQWSGSDLYREDKLDKIKDELADVFTYAILLADAYNLDIEQIIEQKLIKNGEKYPVDKAKGNSKKYTEL